MQVPVHKKGIFLYIFSENDDNIWFTSAPSNSQLWVCYAQIWILTHRLEIHASSLHTRIFKAIKIVDGHLVQHETRSIRFGRQNSACLTIFLSTMLIGLDVISSWFRCHFRQLYFIADWLEIHFLCKLSLPFYTFIFTSAENMLLLPGLHMGSSSVLVLTGSHSHCNSFVVNQFLFSHQMEKIPFVIHPRSNESNGMEKMFRLFFY